MQSTISRFACRILVERDSHKTRIYAAGLDLSLNIFLRVSMAFCSVCMRDVGGREIVIMR
jgi:Pellino